jgi:F-box/leucine-rich repeat protein 10/11
MPDPENFSVRDIKNCVGSKRVVDVIDVSTQKALTMTMKDWCRYYESDRQNRLLNVISLEFSHTKLDNLVDVPSFIKKLDWVCTTWPQSLIATHTESTNVLNKMKYPKVQK